MTPRPLLFISVACFVAFLASSRIHVPLFAQSSANVSVNGAQQFQIIDGFGVNANVASWNNGELRPALDLLVDQLGATLWRVAIDNVDWEASNDNADPNVFNWTYYNSVYTSPKFEELWSTLAYLNQKGIANGLILSFMGPVASWMGGIRINTTAEDKWVEMIASLIYYGRVTRGLQFTMLSPMNEPDWDGIEGPQVDQWQYARLMRKLSQKLDGLGLNSIRLVGPETAAIGTGVNTYMPEMMADSVLMAKVDHFAFHNYAGDSGGADAAIKSSGYPTRNFWITEVTNIWDMFTHLSQGPSATLVWDAYDSVYNHAILAGRGTTPPNDAGNGPALLSYNSSTRIYTPRKGFYECAQLFKYVGPGSRRIGTTDSSSSLTVYAFHHAASGRLTIVGRSTSGSSMTISGTLANVPAVSSFSFYQTTTSLNMQPGPDVVVNGGAFSVSIGPNSVFTLTTVAGGDSVAPSVTVTSPTDGATLSGPVTVSATASDNVGVAGVQFLLNGTPLGNEDTTAPYSITWDTASTSNGSHQVAARARDAAANQTTSTAVGVIVDNTDTVAPSVTVTSPAAGATVSGSVSVAAAASDNVGVAGVQFLLDGAPLGSEDTTTPYSVAWTTTGTSIGSHALSARASDAAGNQTTSAPVTVTVSNGDTTPPTVTATTPANGANVATTVSATFSEPMNPATITTTTVTLRAGGNTVNASVSYSNGTATLTPSASLAAGATYIATVAGGTNGVKDLAGNALVSDVSWSFTTAVSSTCPCSIWTLSATPGPIANDANAVELGVKFRADYNGYITGLRFYKYAQNAGTHVGNLWTTGGTLLATVTFSNETASGWQQATFTNPVAISATTTYVASYHTNTGFYAATNNGLTAAVDRAPLHALSNASAGGNGVYRYGASLFPTRRIRPATTGSTSSLRRASGPTPPRRRSA